MNIYITNNVKKSNFIFEEYFPIIIKYDFEEINNDYLEFSYQDSDLLEFSLNKDSKELKKITLSLCNHFEINNENYQIPETSESTIFISDTGKVECELFILSLYDNCALIKLDSNNTCTYYKSGNVIFGLTADNSISEIIFTLTQSEYNHIKFELENL